MKRLEFQLENDLFEQIKLKSGDMGISEFMRQSAVEKLEKQKIETREFYDMSKKINKIDAGSLHKSLSELIVTTQVIFEELRKQNEILKLIHRRSTFSSVFSKHGLDEIRKSDELSKSVQVKAIELTQDELKQLKF